jgi:beta-alanine degradation protein BauB
MKKAKPVSRVDNAQVRVTEWQFEPGAATGHHRHEFDYVVVPLDNGVLRLVAAGGEAGDKPLAFVEIELFNHPL